MHGERRDNCPSIFWRTDDRVGEARQNMVSFEMMSGSDRLNFAQLCARLVNDQLSAVQEYHGDVRWRCGGKACQKEVSARIGTWFQVCEQPIRIMLLFIRAWAEKETTAAFCRGKFYVC
uniref:Uncharacterized protein n=1 Tax=Trichuris muris TaxID=70415 RepID=A0A5S6QJZ4_TRIMR